MFKVVFINFNGKQSLTFLATKILFYSILLEYPLENIFNTRNVLGSSNQLALHQVKKSRDYIPSEKGKKIVHFLFALHFLVARWS